MWDACVVRIRCCQAATRQFRGTSSSPRHPRQSGTYLELETTKILKFSMCIGHPHVLVRWTVFDDSGDTREFLMENLILFKYARLRDYFGPVSHNHWAESTRTCGVGQFNLNNATLVSQLDMPWKNSSEFCRSFRLFREICSFINISRFSPFPRFKPKNIWLVCFNSRNRCERRFVHSINKFIKGART